MDEKEELERDDLRRQAVERLIVCGDPIDNNSQEYEDMLELICSFGVEETRNSLTLLLSRNSYSMG